jgi:hypothetical protein
MIGTSHLFTRVQFPFAHLTMFAHTCDWGGYTLFALPCLMIVQTF